MPPKSRLSIAKPDIVRFFEEGHTGRIYSRSDIDRIVTEHRSTWRLTESTTTERFISYLLENTKLRKERLAFSRPTVRFTWGEADTWSIIQSVNPKGYFSHYSAVQFHGLTEQLPKAVYFNIEQQATGGGGRLLQSAIDRTFRGKCRITNNKASFRELTVYLLNGKNTNRLGVMTTTTSAQEEICVTTVERTLIDITVRPVYAGGVAEVAKAFERAHGRFSVNKLAAVLTQMNFTYPYHQCLGYYLQRTGLYKPSQVDLLRKNNAEFDFYLDYGLKDPDYNAEWRLFIPKGF